MTSPSVQKKMSMPLADGARGLVGHATKVHASSALFNRIRKQRSALSSLNARTKPICVIKIDDSSRQHFG
jgi:hypothetical protein